MKKIFRLILVVLLIGVYGIFALGSGSDGESTDQGTGSAQQDEEKSNLGEYQVDIVSCRLAKSYDNKSVVIVKYKFTNNSDDDTAFYIAFEDNVYQNGVGLNCQNRF